MRSTIAALALFLLFVPVAGTTQDTSQLYYTVQTLQAEVRTLQNRVQQLEVRQYDPRPREEPRDFEALRQQLSRMEERIGQLESRTQAPKPPAARQEPQKK